MHILVAEFGEILQYNNICLDLWKVGFGQILSFSGHGTWLDIVKIMFVGRTGMKS